MPVGTVIRPPAPLFDRPNPAREGHARRMDAAGADFGEALTNLATTVVGQILPGVVNAAGGAAGLGGGALGVGGRGGAGAGALGGGQMDQVALLQLQEQMQQRAQWFQTISNVSKAEHESKMNAVRNVKAG